MTALGVAPPQPASGGLMRRRVRPSHTQRPPYSSPLTSKGPLSSLQAGRGLSLDCPWPGSLCSPASTLPKACPSKLHRRGCFLGTQTVAFNILFKGQRRRRGHTGWAWPWKLGGGGGSGDGVGRSGAKRRGSPKLPEHLRLRSGDDGGEGA